MIEDPTLIDVAGSVGAAGILFLCREARKVLSTLEDHETAIYGTDEDDGNEGIATVAVRADRRSRRNEDRVEAVATAVDVPLTDGGQEAER